MTKGPLSLKGRIETFDFPKGRIIGRNYQIVERLGVGWESEVYLVREVSTGIERAAKFFFPHRNIKDRAATAYSNKLHELRDCPMVVQYMAQEKVKIHGREISVVISEFVKGEILFDFLKRQPGKKLSHFTAVHLLYSITVGLEAIHQKNQYHGDLHAENIIICGFGLHFDIKLLDTYYWKAPRRENIQDDICAAIEIFYHALGGPKNYTRHPAEIKNICCGLKRSLILKKFRTAGILKNHLELLRWGIQE